MVLTINNSKEELVIDPYKHKERYEKWVKKKEIDGISAANKRLILDYLSDMENGLNISHRVKKGSRSFTRLNTLRSRMSKLAKLFKIYVGKTNMTELNEEDLAVLFNGMRKGNIKKDNGKQYQSTADYIKIFKAFWHWHMARMKKQGKIISDITQDLDATYDKKPEFTYFTFEELKKLEAKAKYKYKILMNFMFDSGIRSPTELANVKVKDLKQNPKISNFELDIREETSKTFGRRIKLMLCSDMLRRYVESEKLKNEDFIFKISPRIVNQYLKRLAKNVLGKEITMYDFRHSSACYWLPKYKSESALKYRFGWKQNDMIHYYTELLGMKDTISENDLIDDETKTLLEREIQQEKRKTDLLEEDIKQIVKKLDKFSDIDNALFALFSDPKIKAVIKERASLLGLDKKIPRTIN